MRLLTGTVSVTHERLYKDRYHGDIVLSKEQYRLHRHFPFSSWRSLDSFGIGNPPGSKYEWLPVKLDEHTYWSGRIGHRLQIDKLDE